ncbi:MAG: HD domain-containing protein [Phycisphaerae bacterium]|nr:HD domain-containing protein [Phycisphaerae bacterium]
MSRIAVGQLTPAMNIEQIFLISQPQLRATTRGDMYIAAFLGDKTGKLNGRMWQASETIFHSLPEDGFVWVRGRTETYQNNLQLVIEEIKPVDAAKVDLSEFMPSTQRDITEMWNKVLGILDTIKNPHLRLLVKSFLEDTDLMNKFRKAPAAIALHHAYVGGLLEHTLSLMELGQRVLPQYPQLDSDLITIGLFLHDIGKTTELEYNINFKYSSEGRLIGHLVKGAMLVADKVKTINENGGEFPVLLGQALEHIIVSHHGIREYGCPVMPSMPEAFVVHFLDNLDSKVALTFDEIGKDDGTADWTNFVRATDSPLLKVRPANM